MNYTFGLLLLLICLYFLFQSCKTVDINPESYEKEKIYFGGGGGFTGELKEYCLLESGDLFKINPSSRAAALSNNIKKSAAKKILNQIKAANFQDYNYDQPGNMFYWMKHQTKADSSYLIWGHPNIEVDEEISSIYKQLISLTKQQ